MKLITAGVRPRRRVEEVLSAAAGTGLPGRTAEQTEVHGTAR